MPELPDVTVYVERLTAFVLNRPLERIRIASPFVLRSVDPPPNVLEGKPIRNITRLGKRIVFEFDDELYLVIHLVIAGRLRWRERGKAIPKKLGLAALDLPDGTLMFTEAGSKKRASMYVVRGREALKEHDRGGVEIFDCTIQDFAKALRSQNRTLKRGLTNPRTFSGIGNAYSDEILHAARLSPLQLTRNLDDDEVAKLFEATQATLRMWTDRLRADAGDGFPDKVTAFREGMAVHGRYRQPCPVCSAPIQRIRYADNEANYCARCQTGGKLLADRAFSRLLKKDWPRTIDEWEEGK